MPDVLSGLRATLGKALRQAVGCLARFAPESVLRIVNAEVGAEAQRRNAAKVGLLSDGEFVIRFSEVLFQGRGADSDDVERWKELLDEAPARREAFLRDAVTAYLANPPSSVVPQLNDPGRMHILGTSRSFLLQDWQKLKVERGVCARPSRAGRTVPASSFQHTGEFKVSAIASLYKGGKHIEAFLENITAQTIFDRSELIIIDANSPENEAEIIDRYRKIFPNIIYKRINYKIGIYDAWNLGVEMSRGQFITNTNLDDLRKENSFELQASTLERHDFVNIVYQDFFYSMDSRLSFDDVAKIGIKSDLPIITPHNLLLFNSPHNAPMWRRTLHDELGLFDTALRSAGDWEFWLRCISRNKTFYKINEPHVVYFNNPEGISTRPDTKGFEEGLRLRRSYGPKLVSRQLRMSRKEFSELLGSEVDWSRRPSYYDVVHNNLERLGHSFRTHGSHHQSRSL
jgi:glycosyltransferase involved in cell wall biosynthesis